MFKDVQHRARTASHGPVNTPEPGAIHILRLPAVIQRVGLSRSSIYARIRRGTFPRSVSLGPHSIGFVEQEINAWLKSVIERRPPPAKHRLEIHGGQ
jgi:prophage regulatory protein